VKHHEDDYRNRVRHHLCDPHGANELENVLLDRSTDVNSLFWQVINTACLAPRTRLPDSIKLFFSRNVPGARLDRADVSPVSPLRLVLISREVV
jgi:hypothetical protein